MATRLARAHILGQQRLRRIVTDATGRVWRGLPSYDERNVDQWLAQVLPLIEAGQRQSAALTEAYLARSLERQPLGVDLGKVTGADARKGTPPEEVYRRPFVTLWKGLTEGKLFDEAAAAALARAESTAAMDIQLASRETFDAVEQADDNIYGYQRVADGEACEFCLEVDGAYVKASDGFAFALHNHCGCTLEPLTEPHPRAVRLPDGTRIREYQYGPLNDKVAVHDHGELGPLLGSPDHDFTSETDI